MDHTIRERIQYLLDRCMQDQLTVAERQELDAFTADEKYTSFIQELLLQAFYTEKPLVDMSVPQREQILEAIYTLPTVAHRPVRRIDFRWVAAAAAVVLLFGFFFLREQRRETVTRDQQAVTTQTAHSTTDTVIKNNTELAQVNHTPAKEQAILTLSDGEQLLLDQLKVGSRLEHDDFSLVKLDAGKLEFRFKESTDLDHKAFQHKINTLVTPRGGIYTVVLGDGTRVQLNASSRLTFPSYFSGEQRLVQLEGEAYFEVAKDQARQFIVRSGKGATQQEVLVYGTTFNISAYPGDQVSTTTLVEGSVKLRQVLTSREQFLKPLEQAKLQHDGITLEAANMDVNLAWVKRLFYFADHDIDQVMQQLSRWYDVDIRFAGGRVTSTFWGQISRDKMLSEVLDILAQTNDVQFEIKGKEVTVMGR